MEQLPIVAPYIASSTVPLGKNLAEDFSNPNSVIFSLALSKYFFQITSFYPWDGTIFIVFILFLDGVPPDVISNKSPSLTS